jgi:hypothetical protein
MTMDCPLFVMDLAFSIRLITGGHHVRVDLFRYDEKDRFPEKEI